MRAIEFWHDAMAEFEEGKYIGTKHKGSYLYPLSDLTPSDRHAPISEQITSKYGEYVKPYPDVFFTVTKKLKKGKVYLPRYGLVGMFRLLDKNHEPVENVPYGIMYHDNEILHVANSGKGGRCDILPFGDPVYHGAVRWGLWIIAVKPVCFVELWAIGTMFYGWDLPEGRLPDYLLPGVLPHRPHFYLNGCLSYSTRGPPDTRRLPARRFYHWSRHPSGAYRGLTCRGFLPFGSGDDLTCLHRRRENWAAETIQRAVRHWLWAPGTGVMYKKAEARFAAASSSTSPSVD